MKESEILDIANGISSLYGLRANLLEGMSVGVGGDHRTEGRIIVLEGPFPGHEALAIISTKISNVTGVVNRVTFDLLPNDKETP